jgi:hypothetical protein
MGHFENGATSAAVPSFVRPAGQFTTTASDMATLARFLMGDGRAGRRPLINPSLLRARGAAFETDAARNGLDAGYALAWARRDRHGVIGSCHDGNIVGYFANFCIFPDEQKAFFIAFNADAETADYERFDAMLVRALGVASVAETPVFDGENAMGDGNAGDGFYLRRPIRLEQFAYLDEVLNFTRVRWSRDTLWLRPFQGADRALLPVGGALFRATDRATTSHVTYYDADGTAIIGDGFRTYERVPLSLMLVRWFSLIAGILGVAHLVFWGVVRGVRKSWRERGALRTLGLESVAAAIIVVTLWALVRRFDFLTLGDPTLLNGVIALLCLAGLGRLGFYTWRLVRANEPTLAARLDLLAAGAALQWCIVLASWGLFPLMLWR